MYFHAFRLRRTVRVVTGLLMALASTAIVARALDVLLGMHLPEWALVLPILAATVVGLMLAEKGLSRCHQTTCDGMIMSMMVLLVLAFVFLYPPLTSGQWGFTSDRDEALNMAVDALVAGQHPYLEKTFTPGIGHEQGLDGNPISAMPGAVILAVPFRVLFGNAAWQTLFWLFLLYIGLRRAQSSQIAAYSVLTLAFCATFWSELLTGGDMLGVGLIPLAAFIWMVQSRNPYGWAIILGLAIAARPHGLLMLLPILVWCWRSAHLPTAMVVLGGALVPTMAVWAWQPDAFSPLHAASKLDHAAAILPHPAWWVAALTVVVVVCMMPLMRRITGVFYAGAVVFGLPVIISILLDSVARETLALENFGWYAIAALPWLIAAMVWRNDSPVMQRLNLH